MSKINLVCENLSYSIGDRKLFNNISISLGSEKTGLVGSNGVGKTTLIKLLIGELKPETGVVYTVGKIGYLPQQFIIDPEKNISSVLGIEQKIKAFENINSGIGADFDFEIIGQDWDFKQRAEKILHQCNLSELDLSRTIKTLSGGQITRVFFASLLMQEPDFLILDEPTNNLDYESRLALYDIIKNSNLGFLIVSHDRQLLSLMDQILELTSLGIKFYGGNYADYVKQKKIEQEALEQDLIDAKKDLSKTKKVVQKSKEAFDKRVAMGNKARRSGGQPKMFLDYHKNRAEVTKSKLERKTDKQLDSVKNKLMEAKSKIEQKDFLSFELEATRVHNTKKILEIQNLTFAYPNNKPCISNFNLALVGPRRIAIFGKNGSGKTTLFKLINKKLEPSSGFINIGVDYVAYLDQFLSILNPELTVLENFKKLNPEVKETDCRLRLAAFLFAHDEAHKKVKDLSGGERMKAALACILMGDAPPQLILLDEPTNNMDLDSIASMEKALKNYKGALIVVSHDDIFLQNIGVEEKIDFDMLKT
ncbi:ATP-binding cassette domain-containing protein [Candidatus Babeliales bacterium]|nr:ATP-binding cassette domain-containing protein [Candidatus Babeliales bacterium]MCF7899201.1 ATP-binding cassette domain-containing protein [Candidatus Babeliales bacterium]